MAGLNGAHLVALALYPSSPWIHECGVRRICGNSKQPGTTVEFMNLLAQVLNFTYEIRKMASYGELERELYAGNGDFSLNLLILDVKSFADFKFLPVMSSFQVGFAVRKQTSMPKHNFPPAAPFERYVWVSILIAFFFTILLRYFTKSNNSKRTLSGAIFESINAYLSGNFKILQFGFIFSVAILYLTLLYKDQLLSTLLARIHNVPFLGTTQLTALIL